MSYSPLITEFGIARHRARHGESWPARCDLCETRIDQRAQLCIVDETGRIVASGFAELQKDPRRNMANMRLVHQACAGTAGHQPTAA